MSIQTDEKLTFTLNGKVTPLTAGTTIGQLLADRGLQDKMVVVEINGVIVPRSEFPSRSFASGDVVEIVHFVGGG